jgi:uncharacterized protein
MDSTLQRLRSLTAVHRALAGGLALRQILLLLVAVLLLSASGCAWLDAKQRQILYRPTPGVPADFAGLRLGDMRYFVSLPPDTLTNSTSNLSTSAASPSTTTSSAPAASTPSQQLEMWWLPHPDKTAPTLLYYHGTFRNLPQNLHKIDALRTAGFAVLAVEYRGWGQSSAITPSEQSILQDADLAFSELQRREPRASQRVLYGHSMGSGVAVDVASRNPSREYGAVILESAITSFDDVAREAGWLARLLASFNTQRFASIEKISQVQVPVLMLHGTLDTTVPIVLGQTLFAAANDPKQWQAITGGAHSDLHLVGGAAYQNALRSFKNKYVLGR